MTLNNATTPPSAERDGAGSDELRVLVVCTANQCRSPMAEFLLRHRVQQLGLDWTVSSAGTLALPGHQMHPNTARLLRARGMVDPDWRTRRVDTHSLSGSDLVLTATREHRAAVVDTEPGLRDNVYTILQFADRVNAVRQAGIWDPLRDTSDKLLTALRRSEIPGNGQDLSDPVGRRYRPFKACARVLDHANDMIFGQSTQPTE
ncbi:arsenate reductase/protein-tyrosine-phosphatase family protein [Microlunatus soli]|uniref:Protein-tyrosine phosphatase n=1 Tax=Microlunatus soli TaxID=630515 RepID=A0A1H1SQ45_9ACTN|nr:hypothetical protein [Microlunatus soli]SDS49993.1 protein-tyrosine phosphatase [Microlunatus soli]